MMALLSMQINASKKLFLTKGIICGSLRPVQSQNWNPQEDDVLLQQLVIYKVF